MSTAQPWRFAILAGSSFSIPARATSGSTAEARGGGLAHPISEASTDATAIDAQRRARAPTIVVESMRPACAFARSAATARDSAPQLDRSMNGSARYTDEVHPPKSFVESRARVGISRAFGESHDGKTARGLVFPDANARNARPLDLRRQSNSFGSMAARRLRNSTGFAK